MRRSQLETKYLKTKVQTDLKLSKKHKNFCSKIYKRERRKYYEPLDMKNVLDSKEFWKTRGPFLSNKNTVFSQISIEKISRIISDDFDLSDEFSTSVNKDFYFCNTDVSDILKETTALNNKMNCTFGNTPTKLL